MNFREHKELKAKIIVAESANKLQLRVNDFCEKVDVIDLQYSSHGISSWSGAVSESWSVFILYREKGDK